MRIVVIGAGIIGITTAWELIQEGHKVTVIDEKPEVALGASFANGGQITISHPQPWAHPKIPKQIIQKWGKIDSPFRWKINSNWQEIKWVYLFLRNCTNHAWKSGIKRNRELAKYSQEILHQTKYKVGDVIDYQIKKKGNLQLLEEQSNKTEIQHFLEEQYLETQNILKYEPALKYAVQKQLCLNAIYTKNDEMGDAYLFTKQMAQYLETKGVKFIFNQKVIKIIHHNNQVKSIKTQKKIIQAEVFILANGIGATQICKNIKQNIPLIPVKGYSITFPVTKKHKIKLKLSLTDHKNKLVITPFKNQLRVAGFAEIGMDQKIDSERVAVMTKRIKQLLPESADYNQGKPWVGFRPMTPDTAPIIDKIEPFNNLWINTGHGPLGWTLAHASAKIIADMINKQTTKINTKYFSYKRSFISGKENYSCE